MSEAWPLQREKDHGRGCQSRANPRSECAIGECPTRLDDGFRLIRLRYEKALWNPMSHGGRIAGGVDDRDVGAARGGNRRNRSPTSQPVILPAS